MVKFIYKEVNFVEFNIYDHMLQTLGNNWYEDDYSEFKTGYNN